MRRFAPWILLAAAGACRPAPSSSVTLTVAPRPAETTDATADAKAEPSPGPSASPKLDAITIPPRPDWTDRYAEPGPDQRRFNITKTMASYGLDRAAAVEAQNFYRDLARAQPDAGLDDLLAQAIARAQKGEFEDRRDVAKLKAAKFIVVFDLDSTLYDQYMPAEVGAACHDLARADGDATRFIKLVPGWDDALRRIDALGGTAVLFTANVDDISWGNGRVWTLDGKAIVESPLVSGFLTNSHLVQQERTEGVTDPRKGHPVQEPSKDLRLFDETLERVIIVDDNPTRLFQYANTRVFKKFDAASMCSATDRKVARTYEQAMPQVVAEIEESLKWLSAHRDATFADAYRPYTMMGQVAVRLARDTLRLNEKQAIAWVRAHPDVVDPDF